ncbi:MAG: sugar phosphate nucleotidyltransferase [Bacteroidales bacterium]|nr:sugar phosphate nucleotidyltransferase [Bacteroidales bacterium]MCM1414535.1 sugar phosphate nucleotidyltransferase [bacterium]MCM1422585.1 sugar phosphate nucleotidyltransferase [bacterium]
MRMDIQKCIVGENTSVFDTMKKIDAGAIGNAFVCRGLQLRAVVSDGDIRRYILSGGSLERAVYEIAHKEPIFLREDQEDQAFALMRRHFITAVPILNEQGEIVRIRSMKETFWEGAPEEKRSLNLPLVIMAGGKGTRLKPYTDILPKPLIPVGDKTITEHIMDRFAAYGCDRVTMIVNYKKDFIKAYYTDNEIYREITFVEEEEYLGTGGGLRLLADRVTDTFFMSNCDILIDADYAGILDYHRQSGNLITMVCAEKKFEIPYGTVSLDRENRVVALKEKPQFDYRVNTGFYVIEPAFLERIPLGRFIHITDVIEKCIADGERVGSYLIPDDAWMDMGQLDELEKMKERLESL